VPVQSLTGEGRSNGLALTPERRDAILGVLEDPPEGLYELRGALIRDWEQRNATDG
jgi:hypothetical protein